MFTDVYYHNTICSTSRLSLLRSLPPLPSNYYCKPIVFGFRGKSLETEKKMCSKNASHSTRLMFIQHSSTIMPFLFIQNMIVIRRSVILHWIVCDIFLRFHPQKHLAKLVPNSFILISFLWGHFLRVRFYFFIAIAVVMAWKSLY